MFDSKEVSCSARLSGSLTAEMAMVFPLFLFAMINILSLFLMFQSYGMQLARLHQSGRQMAVLAYAQGMDAREQDIELVSVEYVKPLIGIIGYRGCPVVSGCVMHKWIGYDLTGNTVADSSEEEMVFAAAHGSVYHTTRSCSYLNPSVKTVKTEEVSSMRNTDGSRYIPCNACQETGGLVYITKAGEHYHSTISCSGLKRTVECITKKSALMQGRTVCSRCGG